MWWYLGVYFLGVLTAEFWWNMLLIPTLMWVVTWLQIRRTKLGVFLTTSDAEAVFYPRSKEAKAMMEAELGREFKRTWTFSGYRVPMARRKEVYERIMHHPGYPQCITQECFLGGQRVNIIDT